jgi:hypothetical protein
MKPFRVASKKSTLPTSGEQLTLRTKEGVSLVIGIASPANAKIFHNLTNSQIEDKKTDYRDR